MPKIRVVRILEYTYPSQEAMDQDMKKWHLPPCGARETQPGVTVRSAFLVDASNDTPEQKPMPMTWAQNSKPSHAKPDPDATVVMKRIV